MKTGTARYICRLCRLHASTTSAGPVSARWPVGRMSETGLTDTGRGGAPNPEGQLGRYIENGGFFRVEHVPDEAAFYMNPWNTAYQDWAVGLGFYDKPAALSVRALYVGALATVSAGSGGASGERQPPDYLRDAHQENRIDPLPIWYDPPLRRDMEVDTIRLSCPGADPDDRWPCTIPGARQNAWLRQIHGRNPLYLPTKRMLADAWFCGGGLGPGSPHPMARSPCRSCAYGRVSMKTPIWTWNAIGKRKGAWALEEDASRKPRRAFC